MIAQDIITTYETIAQTTDVQTHVAEDAFSALKKICIGYTSKKDILQNLASDHHNYLDDRFSHPDLRDLAKKKNGHFKIRKIKFPTSLRTTLEEENIIYVEKDPHLIVCGLPDGYYTALQTIIRAVTHKVDTWHTLGKSAIDTEIRKLKAAATAAQTDSVAYYHNKIMALVQKAETQLSPDQFAQFHRLSNAYLTLKKPTEV